MAAWKYIKGDSTHFLGAPDWAIYYVEVKRNNGRTIRAWEGDDYRYCYTPHSDGVSEPMTEFTGLMGVMAYKWFESEVNIVAQRIPVTSINDDRLAQDMGLNDFPLVSEKYPQRDNVNHPKHYTQGGIECIDAIKAATVGKSGIEAVCVANVVKYLWRYEEKNGVEDVKKARWYLERLIEEMDK